MYQKTELDNGLRVVSATMPKMQSVALGIWIKVGGRFESHLNKGISHYMEHIAFKGSRKYSCRQIKETIEGKGGSLNAFTGEESTCYLVKIPARHLDVALDILSDMVIRPVISAEDVEKERTVILEEIKMYKDHPQSYVYELMDELLWPDHPLGMGIIGTNESVGRLQREDIALFRVDNYTPANIVVSAAGRINHASLSAKVKKIFVQSRTKGTNSFLEVRVNQAEPKLKVFEKDTEQTHFTMGFHSYKREHPMRHALGLLNVVLGANMSSRLFNEIREKRGLAYEIGTQVKRLMDTGAFIVHAGIDNRKVADATTVILQELGKIKKNLIRRDELLRSKDFYLGQLMLALEDTMDHMLWVGDTTLSLDRIENYASVSRQVNKVSLEDIRTVARDIFREGNLNVAMIGPLKDRYEEIKNLLHIA